MAPAAPAQIALEVADADKEAEKDASNGILLGKTDDQLRDLADAEVARVQKWDVNFGEVSLPNPSHGPTTGGPPPEELRPLYDQFNFQREAQALAMKVVRDMHLASNKEEEVYGELDRAGNSTDTQHRSPRASSNKCAHATLQLLSSCDSTGPPSSPRRRARSPPRQAARRPPSARSARKR